MQLFAGSSHPALAQTLAKELNIELGSAEVKKFSCGECYVRYKQSLRGNDVYLLQTGTTNSNEDLMELFLMCQAAKLSFASSVHVIMPHFPYARQDRVSAPREPISAKLIATLLEQAGADHVMTMNLHSRQIQGFFSIPVDVLDMQHQFVEYFRAKKLKDPVVVAPDIGSAKDSKHFADLFDAELAILHKSRPEHQKTEILEIVGNIEGRTCIIYDDMIDTAGTLASAKDALIERGANPDVYAAATHGIFSGPAVERLAKAQFKEVVVTDTIPQDQHQFPGLHVLPIAPLLTEVIQHVQQGQSVTEIYKKEK